MVYLPIRFALRVIKSYIWPCSFFLLNHKNKQNTLKTALLQISNFIYFTSRFITIASCKKVCPQSSLCIFKYVKNTKIHEKQLWREAQILYTFFPKTLSGPSHIASHYLSFPSYFVKIRKNTENILKMAQAWTSNIVKYHFS